MNDAHPLNSFSALCAQQLTADGFAILEKAVIEHNMAATGRVYDNIRFSELGRILGLDENRVEKVQRLLVASY